MLFALAQPAACVGLVVGFALGCGIRFCVQSILIRLCFHVRRGGVSMWRPRQIFHPLGVVALCLGGVGFGAAGPALPSRPGRWRAVAVRAAGPLSAVVAAGAVLTAYVGAYPRQRVTELYLPSDVLRGIPEAAGGAAGQLWATAALGLLCFGLVAAAPLPPADGWDLVQALRSPGAGGAPKAATTGLGAAAKALTDRRLGAVALMLALCVPLGSRPPAGQLLLDLAGTPLMRAWPGALPCPGAIAGRHVT